MDYLRNLCRSPQYKICYSKCNEAVCSDSSGAYFLRPNRYWHGWIFLLTCSATSPLLILSLPLGIAIVLSILLAATYLLAAFLLFFRNYRITVRFRTMSQSKNWKDCPAYYEIKKARTIYPYLAAASLVFLALCYKLNDGDKELLKFSACIDLYILICIFVSSILIYCLLIYITSCRILKLPWINDFFTKGGIPEHVKALVSKHIQIDADHYVFHGRYKDDLSKQLYRTAIKTCFFSMRKKSLCLETIPIRFILLFLGAVLFPYLLLIIFSVYFSFLDLDTYKPVLASSSIIWAFGSFSYYAHIIDQLLKDALNNRCKKGFDLSAYLPVLLSQQEWLKANSRVLSKDGQAVFSVLVITLTPFLWSLISVLD